VNYKEVLHNDTNNRSGKRARKVENVFEIRKEGTVGDEQGKDKGNETIQDKGAAYPDKCISEGSQKIGILKNINVIFYTDKRHGTKAVPVKKTDIESKTRRHYKKNGNKNHRRHQIKIIKYTYRSGRIPGFFHDMPFRQ